MGNGNLIEDIAVEWESGIVKGFKSKKEAERYIDRICKKTAPNFNYYVSIIMQQKAQK